VAVNQVKDQVMINSTDCTKNWYDVSVCLCVCVCVLLDRWVNVHFLYVLRYTYNKEEIL